MDKNAIRDFAVRARYKLISEIATKANMIGISENGIASPLSQSTSSIQYFDIGGNIPYSISGDDIKKRQSLINVINERIQSGQSPKDAFQDTVEEIAYTWFNRIIAIRFMEVNGYLPDGIRVLSSEEKGKKEPDLVTNYFDAELNLNSDDLLYINELKAKNKPDDLFKFLFIRQCNKLGETLPFLFEKTEDYCELMLSISYTDDQGIVNQLINSVSEEDFKEAVEIIGWMYQYYIAQKKEEVFSGLKNNTKITKSTLPSATQIFTPNWIVKYMTDNTLGKLWIESHPGTSIIRDCEYYLQPVEQEESVKKQLNEINKYYKNKKLEDITFIDPCCGSGHILVYAFDLFYKMYQEQGYVSSDIPSLIIKNNLYGIDVDKRAMQLTCFALSMKARSYDKRYFKRGIKKPHVIDVQESNAYINDSNKVMIEECLREHIKSSKELDIIEEVMFKFEDAELYGSLIKDFKYTSDEYYNVLLMLCDLGENLGINIAEIFTKNAIFNYIIPLLKQAWMMSKKYDIVVTNPPYAGNNKLSSEMCGFLSSHYKDSKADLFSAFIERNKEFSIKNGHLGIMCPNSWMFLSSFIELRKKIINNNSITSLIQLSNSGFAEAVVFICTFTLRNIYTNEKGEFIKLTEFNGADAQPIKTKEAIRDRECGYRYSVSSDVFRNTPENTIAFWASQKVLDAYKNTTMEDIASPRHGLATSDNARFLRFWHEVDFDKTSLIEKCDFSKKWYPLNKGGAFRKWYGNNEWVINYENDGKELKDFAISIYKCSSRTIQNTQFYFKKSLTWSALTSGSFSVRWSDEGAIFGSGGYCAFASEDQEKYILALLNSKVCASLVGLVSPTVNYEVGHIKTIPIYIDEKTKNVIDKISQENIDISKNDWDESETSWDFERFVLRGNGEDLSIKEIYENYKNKTNDRFNKLKENEETLNKLFIDIYGLESELDKDVQEKDVTVSRVYDTKQEIPENMKNNIYVKTKQSIVKDLISYIIGCIFGRYSLDENGLACAGNYFDNTKYVTFNIDRDNIIPITDDEYFDDDIVLKINDFVRKEFGVKHLNENLQFIADAIGNNGENPNEVIRNYLIKDFFKDHCQKYQNRPIYWLFDSGKNNGFKALIYLHRYNEDTIGKMRADYLHKVQRVYENESVRMQDIIDNSTDNREVAIARKQKEKFTKQLLETKEYDEVLGHIALQRIPLDLDDGVVVNYQKFQNIEVVNNGRKVKNNLLVDIYKGKK